MQRIKPHLALLLANSIWAINYPLYNIIYSHGAKASAMLELSLVVAAVMSFVPLLWSKAERVERGDIKYLIAAAVLSGLLRKGLVIFSLSLTSPVDASIIASLVPITALVVSVVMGIDRFTTPRVVGILLGMGGAMAIILGSNSSAAAHSALAGNLMMVVYTLAAALYMVWLQPLFKRYKPITLLRWVYSLSALMFLPFSAEAVATTHFAGMSTHLLWATIFVIVVPTFLPNFLLNYALGRVTPTISSIYSYIQPILAIVVSVSLGLEKLRWEVIVYGAVIVAGVALVIDSYSKRARA